MDNRQVFAPSLPAAESDVLHLLVVGATRLSIAKRLSLSTRSVDTRIAALKEGLRTTERFCVGYRSVEYGYVSRDHPITHAATGRSGTPLSAPASDGEKAAVEQLAAGATVESAAGHLGVSIRTVRGYLSSLAHASGASGLAHLGALAAALGWAADGADGLSTGLRSPRPDVKFRTFRVPGLHSEDDPL